MTTLATPPVVLSTFHRQRSLLKAKSVVSLRQSGDQIRTNHTFILRKVVWSSMSQWQSPCRHQGWDPYSQAPAPSGFLPFYFLVLEASLGRVLLEYTVLVFYSATFFSGLVNILAKNFNSGVLLWLPKICIGVGFANLLLSSGDSTVFHASSVNLP